MQAGVSDRPNFCSIVLLAASGYFYGQPIFEAMKKMLLVPAVFFSFLLTAQVNESFDIATYTVPEGWKKDSKQGVVIYTKTDAGTGGFCILALYAAEKSTGDPAKDFEQEWKDLAVTPYGAEPAPATETQTTADGWKAVAGASAAKQDDISSYIVLTVFSGFGKRTSVLANLNDPSYVAVLDQFLQSIKLDKTASKPVANNDPAISSQLLGKWAKSSSGPPQYSNGRLVNFVNAGYHKAQYDFKSDGSYHFHGESQFSSNDFAITDEKGKYTVSGNQLTVIPASSSVKKVDLNGKLKKLDRLALTKRNYTWQFHYFEGIRQMQLVLSAANENMLDGGFKGNDLFPRSFLYSREYKPEWRFIPQ